MTLGEKISRYMDAGFPAIYLHTFEEDKADDMIYSIAGGRKVLEYSIVKGLRGVKNTTLNFENTENLVQALKILLTNRDDLKRTILVLKDAHFWLENPEVIALLKYLLQRITLGLECNVVIISPILKIPKELESYMTILTLDYMKQPEIRELIENFCAEQQLEPMPEDLLNELSLTFKGLSEFEIINILGLALAQEGTINRANLDIVFEQKQQVIKKSGILEMIPLKESLEDIGGLENLKKWLKRKSKIFRNVDKAEAYGVDIPKGVLIAGMPGCGKSLNAKATAKLFNVPLLRLDMGRLMGKYVGESEANMRKAIALADAISPCVLWIDEMEKAFAGIGNAGGSGEVVTRLFGTFLTWLQEKDSLTFVVATANNIIGVPAELFRKGRFDEIFFVDFPKPEERKKIFEIHIRKRRKDDLAKIDVKKLVDLTEGYSGADIEGVVRDSVEDAFVNDKTSVTTDDIVKAIKNTHSLSEIMADKLKEMQDSYKQRKFKSASE